MDMESVERKYISLKETAIYLGLSQKTLYQWAENGEIPSYKLGRVWRFDRREIDEFVHKRYNPPTLSSTAGVRLKGKGN